MEKPRSSLSRWDEILSHNARPGPVPGMIRERVVRLGGSLSPLHSGAMFVFNTQLYLVTQDSSFSRGNISSYKSSESLTTPRPWLIYLNFSPTLTPFNGLQSAVHSYNRQRSSRRKNLMSAPCLCRVKCTCWMCT